MTENKNQRINTFLITMIVVICIVNLLITFKNNNPIQEEETYHNYVDLIVENQAVRLDMNGSDTIEFQTLNTLQPEKPYSLCIS